MSSPVPPSLPPKAASSKPKSSSKSKVPPSRSARREKNGGASTGKDVTHVVRVTVLGLAGITVDRSKCRYSSKDAELPASPSKMRAVVAFSRNSVIRGTTTLSKTLTRSPNDDVVVATTETVEEVSSVAKSGEVEVSSSVAESANGDDAAALGRDDEAAHETKSTKGSLPPPPRRHLAVWASEDRSIGSTVTFEANLHRSDTDGTNSTAASSTFAPKSFDLTIGLTKGNNRNQTAVALPLGVATLAVSGDETTKGESVTVDLPVWTLSQARPLDTLDGTGGYPLITLAPASETTADGVLLKKKRTGLQRLFSKKDKNGNISFPSSAERDSFASAYSMDSAGDAILRVSVDVYEKSSAGGFLEDTVAHTVIDQKSRRKVSNRPGSPVCRKGQDMDTFDDDAYNSDEETELTNETDYSDEGTDFTGSFVTAEDETITLDDSMVTNEDNRMAFFSWVNRPGRPRDDDRRKRGKMNERQTIRLSFFQESQGEVSINVLGRQVRLPACERSNSGDSREDMTHVTADFFGDSYQIPLCRGVAKKEDDSTTSFTRTEQNSASGSSIIMDMLLCQHDVRDEEDLKVVSTFSTLTENPSPPRQVFVMNDGKNSIDGGSVLSDEAKIPGLPDEPSEVDDIMRIVRSKLPKGSPKARAVLKAKGGKNSVTDGSPKGVEEIVDMEADEPANPRSRIMHNISDVLQCHYPAAHNIGPRYEPFEPQIPPVVIRSEADIVSVGELTATTLERNTEGASDARLLERARQMLNESRTPRSKDTEPHKFMPIPIPLCGGDGICAPLVRRDTTSSPIRLNKEETISILEGKESHHTPDERPVGKPGLDDDDECTTFSPIEVVKVSSEEKGASFSRVRSPSDDKREKEKAIQSLYSESLPVYASMNGDESESVRCAFVESKSKSSDRQLFNPITGQEVEQAFL